MRAELILAPLNHLLSQSGWAVGLLSPFAGKLISVRFSTRLSPFIFQVASSGLLTSCSDQQPASVEIELPADLAGRLLSDRKSIFAAARISGEADFAEVLGKVFRNLRWDAEADLARLVGDLAAHRLARFAGDFLSWQASSLDHVVSNVGEYIASEHALLLASPQSTALGTAISALSDDVLRFEQRLNMLEKRLRT